jgi:S-adenosylmethionine/arginine decarboxylase-like enzyme
MLKDKKPFFVHFVAEIECDYEECNSSDWISNKIAPLLKLLDIQVLKTLSHHFEPLGISQIYILSASHLAIHTWPENKYLHLDIICCKKDINFKKFNDAIDIVFKDFGHNVLELNY